MKETITDTHDDLTAGTHAGEIYYFFAPTQGKLIVMNLATFGLYSLVWFYKNWEAIQRRDHPNIMPFWRTVWSILWAYALFSEIDRNALKLGSARMPSPGGLGFFYFACFVITYAPDPWWLLTFLDIVPLAIANSVALAINAKQTPAYQNSRFTGKNWIAIVIGLILTALVVLGMFIPDPNRIQ